MKQFIKFTKPEVFDISPIPHGRTIEEVIIDADTIESMSVTNGIFYVSTIGTAHLFGYNGIQATKVRVDMKVSEEDFNNAARIILGNSQSTTPTDGNDAGPAIETLENDADPATKEKELLKRVMDEFNNNIVGASMRLGMSVNVLRRKLKSYGLPCE